MPAGESRDNILYLLLYDLLWEQKFLDKFIEVNSGSKVDYNLVMHSKSSSQINALLLLLVLLY